MNLLSYWQNYMSNTISDYYAVSKILNDDIEVLATIIKLIRTVDNNKAILKKLENCTVDEFSFEFDLLLDQIGTKTLSSFGIFIRSVLDMNKKEVVIDKKDIETTTNLAEFFGVENVEVANWEDIFNG